MEQAAAPVLKLVDEAIRLADAENQGGETPYEDIERIARRLAEQRAIEQFRKKEK
jgi:hypothetical protein